MEYRLLGNTGLRVSVIGIGSLGFSRVRAAPQEVEKIVNRALDLGVNIIDTAYAYDEGKMEKAIGRVTKYRRKECIILTRSHLRSPEEFAQTINKSLQNLNTEIIDIYQMHDVTPPEADFERLMNNGVFNELKKAQKAGKVKFMGISTHASPEDMKKIINCGEFDVITVSYNLINYQRQVVDGEDISITEKEILPLAKKRGLGVTIMKPFGGGILAKSPLSEVKVSPIQALKFVISNPCVDTATPGVGNIAELEEDVKAGDPHILLSKEDIAKLREDAKRWGPDFCRNCGYCLPCSEDIPIPQIMRLLMRYKLGEEGKKSRAKKAYINLDVKASACTECKKCEERCPYHLSISKKMKEAQEVFE